MMSASRLCRCRRGTAGAEIALVLPFMLLILFGAIEIGHYFYSEHVLVKGVRDGARYAARQAFTNYNTCSGSPSSTIVNNTENLVRTGKISGGTDRILGWTKPGKQFTITIRCTTTIGSTAVSGIYAGGLRSDGTTAMGAPVITVHASVPYQPLVGYAGMATGIKLNAYQEAAVMGI